MNDPNTLELCEGIGIRATWQFHLRKPGYEKALCSHPVMSTAGELADWGHVGCRRERYCTTCGKLGNVNSNASEVKTIPGQAGWYSATPDGISEHHDPVEARQDAEEWMDTDVAHDGHDVDEIHWGRLMPMATAESYDREDTPECVNDFTCSYRLVPQPSKTTSDVLRELADDLCVGVTNRKCLVCQGQRAVRVLRQRADDIASEAHTDPSDTSGSGDAGDDYYIDVSTTSSAACGPWGTKDYDDGALLTLGCDEFAIVAHVEDILAAMIEHPAFKGNESATTLLRELSESSALRRRTEQERTTTVTKLREGQKG